MIEPAEARPAATVLLLRDASDGGVEVHLQRRRADMTYGARALVFPGGAVDAEDVTDDALALVGGADLASRAARMELGGDERLCAGLHVCAVREVFEETGILLARGAAALDVNVVVGARERVLAARGFTGELRRLGVRPDVDDLAYVARFVTPSGFPRRFDTRFFATRSPEGQTDALHAGEADSAGWFAAGDVLSLAAAGDAVLLPPTRVVLAELARHRDVASVLADLGSREVCGILFTPEMALQTPPDHLPTAAEVEAMGARATPERLAGAAAAGGAPSPGSTA